MKLASALLLSLPLFEDTVLAETRDLKKGGGKCDLWTKKWKNGKSSKGKDPTTSIESQPSLFVLSSMLIVTQIQGPLLKS